MQKDGLKALIYGGTGAIGAELVAILLASNKWASVHCIARRRLEQWNTLPGKQKLTVEQSENLDDYFKQENSKYQGFDSLFCLFGSQTKHGDQTFIKVDKTYPLLAGDIAIKNKIPHYILFTSMGANPNSWLLYPRTKGQVEEDMKKKDLNLLSIFRPGLLKNRRDARTVERLLSWIPFGGIQARNAADVLRIVAQRKHEESLKSTKTHQVYENGDMLKIYEDQYKK